MAPLPRQNAGSGSGSCLGRPTVRFGACSDLKQTSFRELVFVDGTENEILLEFQLVVRFHIEMLAEYCCENVTRHLQSSFTTLDASRLLADDLQLRREWVTCRFLEPTWHTHAHTDTHAYTHTHAHTHTHTRARCRADHSYQTLSKKSRQAYFRRSVEHISQGFHKNQVFTRFPRHHWQGCQEHNSTIFRIISINVYVLHSLRKALYTLSFNTHVYINCLPALIR